MSVAMVSNETFATERTSNSCSSPGRVRNHFSADGAARTFASSSGQIRTVLSFVAVQENDLGLGFENAQAGAGYR